MRPLLLAAALSLAPRPALAQAPVVAVFEIQDTRLGSAKLSDPRLAALTDLLRNFLAEGRSFKVVPQSGLRRAMLDAKKDSYRECFDEACQLEIGKAVSASKVVTSKIIQVGSQCIVTSTMFDLRTETTDRAEHVKGECAEESLALTLEKVAAKLGAARAHAELASEEKGRSEEWDPGRRKKVIASFRSEPAGALVMIDGKLACQDSAQGCRRTLAPGRHQVSMQKERYLPREEEVFIEDGTELVWTLEPNFSTVAVRTDPPQLEVRIDGRIVGRTPIDHELEPGDHLIELADRCYFPSQQRISVLRGRAEAVQLEAAPREGAIEISAVDESGNAVRGQVFIDGKHAGHAPDLIKVNVCARKVRVVSEQHGAWEGSIAVGERQTVELEAKLDRKLQLAEAGEGGTETVKTAPPPGIGLRLGAQAMFGILCLRATGSGGQSSCVDRLTGYGGLLGLQWPANQAPDSGWFFRGGVRAGFLFYPGSGFGPAVYEIPAALAAEVGLVGTGLEYAAGAEAIYVFRKFARLVEPDPSLTQEHLEFEERRDASPHAFDLGLYLAVRLVGLDLGAGVYIPVTGIGDSILGRFWLGYAFNL